MLRALRPVPVQDVLHAQLPAEDANLVERAPLPGAKSQQQPKARPQEPQQPQQLSVKTQLGAGSVSMARASMDSQASSSNWGSHAGGSAECGASYTSPSLRQQVRVGAGGWDVARACGLPPCLCGPGKAGMQPCRFVDAAHPCCIRRVGDLCTGV